MALTPEQLAKMVGATAEEWTETTTATWTLEGCRSDMAKKLTDWADNVVMGGGQPGRVRITRPSGLGTSVKVSYGKTDLIKFKLSSQDPKAVSEVLHAIAKDITDGGYDKQLKAGYEKTIQTLKKSKK